MKIELTKKDKILLFSIVVLGIVFAAVRFAIIPMNDSYNAKTLQLDDLSIEKELMEQKLSSEQATIAAHDIAVEEYNDVKKLYPFIIPNEELDRILTNMCLTNELSPINLSIAEPTQIALRKKSADDEEEPVPPAFVTATVTMSVRGSYDSLKKLLDAVDRVDYIQMSKVSYQRRFNDRRLWSEDEILPTSNVVFEVTMLKETEE